jgi:hypothetical protein
MTAEMLITEFVGALAELKYTAAKPVVYQAVFYWFGIDDTFAAHPELLAIKDRLEKEMSARGLAALPGVPDKKVRCLVFLNNRKELAQNPKAAVRHSLLVQMETSAGGRGELSLKQVDQRYRAPLVKALGAPPDCVGIRYGVMDGSASVDRDDERMDDKGVQFLPVEVCKFLRNDHDANDDRFLRLLVERGLLRRELVDEIIPDVFGDTSPR